MTLAASPPVDVAERVLRLLDEGRYTATYKQAATVDRAPKGAVFLL